MINFEDVNAMLNALTIEHVIEPIDESDCHPMDWAEVTGLVDEMADEIYPEPMVDDSGNLWYVS